MDRNCIVKTGEMLKERVVKMPECHKCEYNGTGNPICLKCKGPSNNQYNRGQVHVSLDCENRDQIEKRVFQPAECVELKLDDCCQDAVTRLLAVLVQLSDDDVLLVLALMRSNTLTAHGRVNGLTRSAVCWRLKQLTEQHPELSFLRPRAF